MSWKPWTGLILRTYRLPKTGFVETQVNEIMEALPVPHLVNGLHRGKSMEFTAALMMNKFQIAKQVLDSVPDDGVRMWLVVEAASDMGFALAQQLADKNPDEPLGLALTAGALLLGAANQVMNKEADTFSSMAESASVQWAQDLLQTATKMEPNNALYPMLAQHCWRPADGKEGVFQRCKAWRKLDSDSFSAFCVVLEQLADLDPDSAVSAFDLAVQLSTEAKPNSSLHALVPVAVRLFTLAAPDLQIPDSLREEFIHQLNQAAQRCYQLPDWQDEWFGVRMLNEFMLAYILLDDPADALEPMLRLQGQVSVVPWSIVQDDDPLQVWESYSKQLVTYAVEQKVANIDL